MEIAAAARTTRNKRDDDNCSGLNLAPAGKAGQPTSLEVFFRSQIVSMKNLLFAGDYTEVVGQMDILGQGPVMRRSARYVRLGAFFEFF
jgi:hypothetical protein